MMKFTDSRSYSLEELVRDILEIDSITLKAILANITPEQVSLMVTDLSECAADNCHEKLLAFVRALENRNALKAFGKALSPKQVLDILKASPETANVLFEPVIAGLLPEVFCQLIMDATNEHLELLKNLALTEAVQHQLVLFLHYISLFITQMETEIEQMQQNLVNLDVTHLQPEDKRKLESAIDLLTNGYQTIHAHLDKVLSIVWHTNRLDLIDKMSSTKEHCHRTLLNVIGHPKDRQHDASGLYALLNGQLSRVFNDCSDESPSIEALAVFSITSREEYLTMGLLPELACDDVTKSVQHQLNKLGLCTVKDVKEAGIFSKDMLADYLKGKKD